MNEAYMTAYSATLLGRYLEDMNGWNENQFPNTLKVVLTGVVSTPDGVVGKIVYSEDEGAYVFVPGAYEVYSE